MAGLLARMLGKSRLPDFAFIGLGIVAIGLHLLVILALPFHGDWGEIPVILAGALAWSGAMTVLFRVQSRPDPGGIRSGLAGGFFLLSSAFVMLPLVIRVGYAHRLTWECDGRIVEQDRSSNHRATRIVVQGPSGRETFESVDESFWNQATVGKRPTKKAGSPMATLDGTPVRMLGKTKFWYDPP